MSTIGIKTLVKQISFLIVILFVLGCKSKSTTNKTNTFVYDNTVEITLPDKYYLESSVIYNGDSIKVGEFSPGLITPLQDLSFSDIYKLSKDGGEIKAKETSVSFDDHEQSKVIEIDSVQLTNYKWYYIIKQTIYEGDGENEIGTWEAYDFITKEKDKVLLVTFYNKELKADKLDSFIKIVQTIKIK